MNSTRPPNPPLELVRAKALPDPVAGAGSDPLGKLLARGLDSRDESRRASIALVTILVLTALALNLAVWQSLRSRILAERWQQLAAQVEARRDAVRARFSRMEAEARSIARRAAVTAAEHAALPASSPITGEELAESARILGFASIHIVARDGAVLASSSAPRMGGSVPVDLVARAIEHGGTVTTVEPGALNAGASLVVALPIPAADGAAAARGIVLSAPMSELLGSSKEDTGASLLGPRTYFAAREGEGVLVVGTPPPGLAIPAQGIVSAAVPGAQAAALAADGAESSLRVKDARGQFLWTVTRFIPELRAGLVGQADRATMLRGSGDLVIGLLALDLGVAALAAVGFWFWRRRLEARLLQRELAFTHRQVDQVRAIFDNAFEAILAFDARGRVASANRAARELFGRSAAQIEGEPVGRFLRCGTVGKSGFFEPTALHTVSCSEAMRLDGTVLPVEFSLTCITDGNERLYTAVVRDISERVEAEDRIRSFSQGLEVTNRRLEEANAQLEEVSRLKSEFLANTSHELRTPLNGMIGFLQLVLDGMCDSREEEREFLTQALQCSRHLLGLINDVLDIAKIEAGKLTLEIEPVDVQSLFGELYTLAHVQAAQKGLALRFEAPEHCVYPVRGDFGKVKQVLLNLIGNSIKFTSHGSITVRATERADLGHYEFEVIDTGIGIPSDRQLLIFEKFTQGDGSTTRRFGGTGLGLAISRSLVELMGGIITVHSDGPGQGTSMYFSLPVWRGEENKDEDGTVAARALEQIEGPVGGPLLLLVEDDGVFRKFLGTLLQHHGYRTVQAASAENGWVLARRLRPSMVILDFALSCAEGASLRTGWDLAERMATDPRTRHIPLVFVTGFDHQLRERLKSTVLARQPEQLMKPVDGATLIAKIEEVLGSARQGLARVLLADDDAAVTAYVRKVLPEDRFHLDVVNNGEECLHALRMQPHGFDLLILDLMMPDVSGYDVLRELTLSGGGTELPVLVLTNFPEARNEEEKRLLEKGLVLDVLAKASVHENPALLPHIIEWHLQVAEELGGRATEDSDDMTRREVAA